MGMLRMILTFVRAFFASRACHGVPGAPGSRANLAAENVLRRQELIVPQCSVKRPPRLRG